MKQEVSAQELLEFYTFGFLATFIGLLSLIFNAAVLFLYNKAFKNQISRLVNFQLVSLSFSSLGICSQFPFMAVACFRKEWIFGKEACNGTAYAGAIFSYAQIYTLTVIAVERHQAVKRSVITSPTFGQIVFKTAIIWLLAIVLATFPYFGFGDFFSEGIGVSCTFDFVTTTPQNIAYVITITVLGFVVPIIIIVFSYISIIRLVRKSNIFLRNTVQETKNNPLKHYIRIREYKTAKTAAKTILAFVISWTPYACIAIISAFGYSVPPLIQTLAAVIAKAQTSLNAVVYVIGHQTFYQEICILLGRKQQVSKYYNTATKAEVLKNQEVLRWQNIKDTKF